VVGFLYVPLWHIDQLILDCYFILFSPTLTL